MWQRIKNIYHLGQATIANYFYGFPSKKLTVIGVTGTDGKTTTTSLIYHILHSSGYNASMITSVGAVIGGKQYDIGFHVTNPSTFPLQRFLKEAAQQKDHDQIENDKKYMVLETSSHGLDQHRVWGIQYAIGVITNITGDHLDYHKTFENYVNAKFKLFDMSKICIINKDDKAYERFKTQDTRFKNKKIITYGMDNADITPKKFHFTSSLIGEFNDYNILAAIAVCQQLGVSDEKIRAAIKSFKAPIGREEIIYDKEFTVMIDFSSTSNSIKQILKAVKPLTKGKLISVFGSAGERDTGKRFEMGKNAAMYADVIILTAEDPRSENVEDIIDQIEAGIKTQNSKKMQVLKISDRKQAIDQAIGMAKKGDYVVLSGKGHEKSMNYGSGEEPWDEFEVANEAIRKKEK